MAWGPPMARAPGVAARAAAPGAAGGGVATSDLIQDELTGGGSAGRYGSTRATVATSNSSGRDRVRPRTNMTPIAPTPAASTTRTTVDKMFVPSSCETTRTRSGLALSPAPEAAPASA